MSQVLVWKSDEDGMLFEDHLAYLSHLRVLSRARATIRKHLKIKQDHDQHCLLMGQVKSISELHTFLIDNWQRYDTKATLVAIKLSVKWYDLLSNTHSCPRSGITNWDRDKNLSLGYSGWYGRINYVVQTKSRNSDRPFDQLPIHTGTGGGSSNYKKNDDTSESVSYSYDVTLWADDFPGLLAEHEKSINWVALGGQANEKYIE